MDERPRRNEVADTAILDPKIEALPADGQPLGDICAGCAELTERVEQLERRLAELGSPAIESAIGTMPCYWLCVGFHALLCFVSFASQNDFNFGYVFVLGGCGTLSVCHVLATRPLIEKFARSALATLVVISCLIGSLWLSGQSDPEDLLPAIAIYLPVIALSGWIAAKLVVWIRGWRIVPPGGSREFFKPSIRDLMLITLAAAFMFGEFRYAIGDLADLFEDWKSLIYVAVPVVTASLIAVFLARVLLSPRASVSPGKLTLVIVAGTGAVIFVYGMLLGIEGNFGDLTELLFYGVISTLIAMVSPLVTFALMRSAGYRFAV